MRKYLRLRGPEGARTEQVTVIARWGHVSRWSILGRDGGCHNRDGGRPGRLWCTLGFSRTRLILRREVQDKFVVLQVGIKRGHSFMA